MSEHECVRCGTKVSIFWWRHSVNCDIDGNEGTPFELCDPCQIDFAHFICGRAIREENIIVRRKKE